MQGVKQLVEALLVEAPERLTEDSWQTQLQLLAQMTASLDNNVAVLKKHFPGHSNDPRATAKLVTASKLLSQVIMATEMAMDAAEDAAAGPGA